MDSFHVSLAGAGVGRATRIVVPAIIVRLTATVTAESTGTYVSKPSLPKMFIASSNASFTSAGTLGSFNASAITDAIDSDNCVSSTCSKSCCACSGVTAARISGDATNCSACCVDSSLLRIVVTICVICSAVASDSAVRTSLNCSAVIGSSGGREVVGGTFTLVEVSGSTGRLVEVSGGLVLVVVAGTGWVV